MKTRFRFAVGAMLLLTIGTPGCVQDTAEAAAADDDDDAEEGEDTGTSTDVLHQKVECNGNNYALIFRRFVRNGATKVLRCGNNRFGYWHIAHTRRRGWSKQFAAHVTETITRGDLVGGRQFERNVCVETAPFRGCVRRRKMIVPYGENAYQDKHMKPVGVITAYYEDDFV